jgi:prophage regulatory protein
MMAHDTGKHTNGESNPAQGELPLFAMVQASPAPPLKIMRLPEVIARVGLKRASIYRFIGEGRFPKALSLGPRAVGWLEHEIDSWLAERLQARNAPDQSVPKR